MSFQFSSPDGFVRFIECNKRTINSAYFDGVSITYGNPSIYYGPMLVVRLRIELLIMTVPVILAVAYKLLLLLLAMTSTVNQLPILEHFLTSFITLIPCEMARSVLD